MSEEITAHLAELDKRLHRAWRHRPTANAMPRAAAARTEPPCVEPDDPWEYRKLARHEAHEWIDTTHADGAYADVAPGSQYHERCGHCGVYRTHHSNQGQPDGGTASYYEYYPWGTAPPAGELTDRDIDPR